MVDEDDIADMYKEYEGKKEVMLWFYSSEKDTSNAYKKAKNLKSNTVNADLKIREVVITQAR